MYLILLTLLLSSCALFQSSKLGQDPQLEFKKICFNGAGDGQVLSHNSKYPFNFESIIDQGLWAMSLKFPFQDELVLEVDLDQDRYINSFENELLKNVQNLNPLILRAILKNWSTTIRNITKQVDAKKFEIKNNALVIEDLVDEQYEFKLLYFDVVDNQYFRYQKVSIKDQKSDFSLDIILRVRECLTLQ